MSQMRGLRSRALSRFPGASVGRQGQRAGPDGPDHVACATVTVEAVLLNEGRHIGVRREAPRI